jgi:F0F1-type ATP synthase membrane subunit b/b'
MLLENILTAGQIAGAIGAIIGTVLLILKYFFYKPLVKLIKDTTRQIQPETNGGKSLSDVALGIARVERKVESVIKRVERLEENLCK